jgi:HTH-type transcriptional regulator/antitoxin HigA
VLCEAVRNCKVRGALTTYKGHPTIYLSGRFRSHDNIWFAFIHEVGHLLKHYNKKDTIISYEDSEDSTNYKEIEVNEFARDFFLDPQEYDKFILNKKFDAESIKQFARKENVLTGIVLARLQHDKVLGYEKLSYLK